MSTWTLRNSQAWESGISHKESKPEFLGSNRPGALPPLTKASGVRQEIIDDALAFMDEYEDVFEALAQ